MKIIKKKTQVLFFAFVLVCLSFVFSQSKKENNMVQMMAAAQSYNGPELGGNQAFGFACVQTYVSTIVGVAASFAWGGPWGFVAGAAIGL